MRGVSPHVLLHCAGYLLKNGRQRRNDHQLSDELEEDVLDYFISHSWSVGRWRKFMALALFFNVRPALAVSITVQLFAFVGVYTGRLRLRPGNFRFFPEGVASLSLWCSILGALSFWLVICCWHERPRCCRRWRRNAFFDTVCIDQSDAAKQREGIDAITAYLCHSNCLLVVLSDQYLQRIWTVFEMTTFLAMCPLGKVMVQPVGLAEITFWCCLLQLLRPAVVSARANFMIFAQGEEVANLAIGILMMLLLEVQIFVLVRVLRKWGIARSQLAHDIQTFTFRSAKCHHEPDRDEIFTAVRHLATNAGLIDTDATKNEACAAMEDRARQLVPELMQGALSPVGLPYWNALVIAMPVLAGMLDDVAVQLRDEDLGSRPHVEVLRILLVNLSIAMNLMAAVGCTSVLVYYPRQSRCAEVIRTLAYTVLMTIIVLLPWTSAMLNSDSVGADSVVIILGCVVWPQALVLWILYGKGLQCFLACLCWFST